MPRYNSRSGKEQRCQNVAEGTPSTYLEWAKQQGQRKKAINTKRKAANQTLLKSDVAGYLVNPDKNTKGKLPASYREKAEKARKIGAESKDPKIKALAEETAQKAEAVAEKAEQLTAPTNTAPTNTAPTPPAPKRRGRKPKSTEPAPVAESTPKPRRSRKPKTTSPTSTPASQTKPAPEKQSRGREISYANPMSPHMIGEALVPISLIASSTMASDFNQNDIDTLSNAMAKGHGTKITRPLIIKQTGIGQFEVVDGHLLYHAAVAAQSKNPRHNEIINTMIVDANNDAILKQIDFLNKHSRKNESSIAQANVRPFPFPKDPHDSPIQFGAIDVLAKQATTDNLSIHPSVPRSAFKEEDINTLADLIIKSDRLVRPITIQGSNAGDGTGARYDIIDGNLEYYAAVEAHKRNPRGFEQIEAVTIFNHQPEIYDQVDAYRSILGTTDPAPTKPRRPRKPKPGAD